jgi:hypothetical protein
MITDTVMFRGMQLAIVMITDTVNIRAMHDIEIISTLHTLSVDLSNYENTLKFFIFVTNIS